jgi:hypothetical protein
MLTDLRFVRFDALVTAWHHLGTLSGVFGVENAHWMPHSLLRAPAGPRTLESGQQAQSTAAGPETAEDALTHPVGRRVLNALLGAHAAERAARRRATFSDAGAEAAVRLRADAEIQAGFHIWYERRYAVLYLSPFSAKLREEGRQARRCGLAIGCRRPWRRS